ncbi:MAG: NTP transferase domain-containing protein [Fimbriimonadaceae bacterium]|nr:NTP transferase domain-containing protein [Fimbriimonadaceae bacterium]QYK56762.1 MAG: NTP transferase domain-containing protein [Fimbriimonadaceae bacterium]
MVESPVRKAVVMAGGEGSRLRPLTANRPKPLVPVAGRPIMGHILSLLKTHGVSDVVGTLWYLADEIENEFGDGTDYALNLSYVTEEMPLGTAGSVKLAQPLLEDGSFFVISGDALTDCDLTKAALHHKQTGALATIVLTHVPNPLEFGIVITEPGGRIKRFLEKPAWSDVFSDTVNTGIYILEPEIFQHLLPDTNCDWSRDIFPRLLEMGAPLYGYIMDDYWCDVGTIAQYMDAQQQVLSGSIGIKPVGEELHPGVWIGEGTVIDDETQLVPPICVGRNSRIKRRAQVGPYSVLGDNTLVEEGAVVERSVVWDSSYLGMDVKVKSATICSRVTIKRESQIQEEAVIGDRCLIDVGCTIRPRIKVWPDKLVERGSTLTMSLVYGNRWRGSLFRDLGVAGISNIEITPEFATRFGLALGTVLPPRGNVVTTRDSSRSSRMIKRSIIASLLSTGCNVIDLRGSPVPIARHYIRAAQAVAAVNVRKLPGNARLTLMEAFDGAGGYIPQNLERKIEAAFYREEFQRVDSDELGLIDVATGAVQTYKNDYFALLSAHPMQRRLRLVLDYGYSSISPIFPGFLHDMNVQGLSLNAYNDARLAPRSQEQIQSHLDNLKDIVPSIGYDFGALTFNEGERILLVDDRGRIVAGTTLFAALCLLIARTHAAPTLVMPVTSPIALESLLVKEGATVIRSKSTVRDLMNTAAVENADLAGDETGGFIFPKLHPGFDAIFALGLLRGMLEELSVKLSDIVDVLPEFHLAYRQVPCNWDKKGMVMRVLAQEVSGSSEVDLLDGIKIYDHSSWVLVRPDSFEPVFHLFAESPDYAGSLSKVAEFAGKIERLAGS